MILSCKKNREGSRYRKAFADLPNLLVPSNPPSTISPKTSCCPDIVDWSPVADEIRVRWKCKQEKQSHSKLISDLEMAGHAVFYDTIEIGSL